MAPGNSILSIMRYAPTWLVLGLMVVIASTGCFFGDDPATEPPDVDLQATIDAALARVAASAETGPAPTATPRPATVAPTGQPAIAPSPPVTATPPPTSNSDPRAFSLQPCRGTKLGIRGTDQSRCRRSDSQHRLDSGRLADRGRVQRRRTHGQPGSRRSPRP